MEPYVERKTYLIDTQCPMDHRPRQVAIIYRIRYTSKHTRELVVSECNYCDFSSANSFCTSCAKRWNEWFIQNFQEIHKTPDERLRELFPQNPS